VKEKERREEGKRGGGRGSRDSGGACILYPACVLSDVLCSYLIQAVLCAMSG